jgi:hypothetical protein
MEGKRGKQMGVKSAPAQRYTSKPYIGERELKGNLRDEVLYIPETDCHAAIKAMSNEINFLDLYPKNYASTVPKKERENWLRLRVRRYVTQSLH